MQEIIFLVLLRGDEWQVKSNGKECGEFVDLDSALVATFRWAESSFWRGYIVSVGVMGADGDMRLVWWSGTPHGSRERHRGTGEDQSRYLSDRPMALSESSSISPGSLS